MYMKKEELYIGFKRFLYESLVFKLQDCHKNYLIIQ